MNLQKNKLTKKLIFSKQLLKHYRLSKSEYQVIEQRLNRCPNQLELALFSALWSEHCSYKSSIMHLKKLHFNSDRVVSGFGENAGVVDLGEGEKIAFKVESHNHPSRITPYQGASTGVGGILRDVFVMNARPIALANYLCFGPSTDSATANLIDGVVRGIGDYGNCMGIPMLTGQTEFHSSYRENIIVNALALGYFGPDDLVISSRAKGINNVLLYVGSETGRDGIHGASMASESLSKDQTNIKSCVQIGDPFYGKLLMEACLEVMRKKWIVSAQDMGAAGLISSSVEMAVKGEMGVELNLDQVPLRDSSMQAEDILLSETQERVLLVIKPQHLDSVKQVFSKWNLKAQVIGRLMSKPNIVIFWEKDCLVNLPSQQLKAPIYKQPFDLWKAVNRVQKTNQTVVNNTSISCKKTYLEKTLLTFLSDERCCSRKFIDRQYDQRVGVRTVKDCSFPYGVLNLPYSQRALALCMGGRPYLMRTDPLEGGKDSVYEPALQLACRGFSPLALTNGLNFGSPEDPQVMSSFVAYTDGLKEGTQALQTPVVSGNVSFYNETKQDGQKPTAVTGTPVTTIIGIKKSLSVPDHQISEKGLKHLQNQKKIYLLSAHQLFCTGLFGEFCQVKPVFYGCLSARLCKDFISAVQKIVLDCSPLVVCVVGKGGLIYTLARMVLNSKKGICVQTSYNPFQERLYELVVVLNSLQAQIWKKEFNMPGVKLECLGECIEQPNLQFNNCSWKTSDLKKAYTQGWNQSFKNTLAEDEQQND